MRTVAWNHELNPLPQRAQYLLQNIQNDNFTGHPIKDIVEVIFECYDILSIVLNQYQPTGDDTQDQCVVALSSLFTHWPPDKIESVRGAMKGMTLGNDRHTRNTDSDRTPSEGSHTPKMKLSFASRLDPGKSLSSAQCGVNSAEIEKSDYPDTHVTNCDKTIRKRESTPPIPSPSPTPIPATKSVDTTTSVPSTHTKQSISSCSGDSLESVGKRDTQATVSTASIPEEQVEAQNHQSTASVQSSYQPAQLSSKNQEYFRKKREEEEMQKKAKSEEESKLTPDELRKLEEEKREAERHDANKTAHLSKLGSNFIIRKDGRVKTDGGGRGNRRGGRG
mmetsp:Transcript_12617/g.19050  ORF Transcript_12617/g.19050 Transcript_12617/m.19050 type:complete len:335 (-) Transcript_12617:281-1285(-)